MWEWHSDDTLSQQGLASLTYTQREIKEGKQWKRQLFTPNWVMKTDIYFFLMMNLILFSDDVSNYPVWRSNQYRSISNLQNISNRSSIWTHSVHVKQLLATVLILCLHLSLIVYLNRHPTCSPHFSGYLSSCHPPSTETPHWQSNVPYYSPH